MVLETKPKIEFKKGKNTFLKIKLQNFQFNRVCHEFQGFAFIDRIFLIQKNHFPCQKQFHWGTFQTFTKHAFTELWKSEKVFWFDIKRGQKLERKQICVLTFFRVLFKQSLYFLLSVLNSKVWMKWNVL